MRAPRVSDCARCWRRGALRVSVGPERYDASRPRVVACPWCVCVRVVVPFRFLPLQLFTGTERKLAPAAACSSA